MSLTTMPTMRRSGKLSPTSRRMLAAAMVLVAIAPGVPAPAAPRPPARIMSANLCTDLMLLMLVPKRRIASISWLAHPAVALLMPGADAGVAINHGTAEDVARDRPDLILAGTFSTPVLRRLAGEVGATIVPVDQAASFADIRRAMRRVGAAVGAGRRAEALIARMDAALASVRRSGRPRVLDWSGGGAAVPGRGTLSAAIITAAGAANAADWDGYASVGLEELLAARPDAVLLDGGAVAPSLHDRDARHPLLARAFQGRLIAMPDAWSGCGLPQSAGTAQALARALARLPPHGHPS